MLNSYINQSHDRLSMHSFIWSTQKVDVLFNYNTPQWITSPSFLVLHNDFCIRCVTWTMYLQHVRRKRHIGIQQLVVFLLNVFAIRSGKVFLVSIRMKRFRDNGVQSLYLSLVSIWSTTGKQLWGQKHPVELNKHNCEKTELLLLWFIKVSGVLILSNKQVIEKRVWSEIHFLQRVNITLLDLETGRSEVLERNIFSWGRKDSD